MLRIRVLLVLTILVSGLLTIQYWASILRLMETIWSHKTNTLDEEGTRERR